MGCILSAIDDNYAKYAYLCKRVGIEPKDQEFWDYDDSEIIKLVDSKACTFEIATRMVRAESQNRKLLRLINSFKREVDEELKRGSYAG